MGVFVLAGVSFGFLTGQNCGVPPPGLFFGFYLRGLLLYFPPPFYVCFLHELAEGFFVSIVLILTVLGAIRFPFC